MKTAYEAESGDEIAETGEIALRLKVLAGELYKTQTNMEWLKRQMFAESADGEFLDRLAAQRGIERKEALKSQGTLTFSVAQALESDVVIPVGTTAATDDSVPVRFVTTEEVTLAAGKTSVSAAAEAEEAGAEGNIKKHKATVAVSVPAEIESVTNSAAFTGGASAEIDDVLRERIRDTYTKPSNGTNAAYYEQLALTIDGVAKAGAVGKANGAGTVNVYVSGQNGEVSSTVLEEVQTLLQSQRELNVTVTAANAGLTKCAMTVTAAAKSGYSDDEVTELLTEAFEEYVNSIDIGGSFYLAALGAKLMETGCIIYYTWDSTMSDVSVSKSQCLQPGTVTIEVV